MSKDCSKTCTILEHLSQKVVKELVEALNIRSESDILSYKEKGEASSKNYI
jgi:hypothetical protein